MAIDEKYTVFLSPTYDDSREERNEVVHALFELYRIPFGMTKPKTSKIYVKNMIYKK